MLHLYHSVVFKRPLDIKSLLSAVYDENGKIVAARATTMTWIGKMNSSAIEDGGGVINSGTGLPVKKQLSNISQPVNYLFFPQVDAASLELEKAMKEDVFDPAHDRLQEAADVTVNINVARGYDDIAAVTIIGDAMMMPLGFMIVFVYVMIMLGRFNCVETRVNKQQIYCICPCCNVLPFSKAFLAMVGCSAIGLTILVTYGLCSAFGLPYGPMHNVIPFLMLGIGKITHPKAKR